MLTSSSSGAEVTLDEFMTVLVNVGVRGNPAGWLLGDKLQVLCQMLTAAVNDIILVYCLAPVKDDGASEAKKASDEPEIAHIFQEGDFSLARRIGCYLDKGRFYALVGAVSCTFSMFLALALSGQMAKLTPEYLTRALLTGALHMGVSANTRYWIGLPMPGLRFVFGFARKRREARVGGDAPEQQSAGRAAVDRHDHDHRAGVKRVDSRRDAIKYLNPIVLIIL